MLSGMFVKMGINEQNEEVRSQAIGSVENCLPTLLSRRKRVKVQRLEGTISLGGMEV